MTLSQPSDDLGSRILSLEVELKEAVGRIEELEELVEELESRLDNLDESQSGEPRQPPIGVSRHSGEHVIRCHCDWQSRGFADQLAAANALAEHLRTHEGQPAETG